MKVGQGFGFRSVATLLAFTFLGGIHLAKAEVRYTPAAQKKGCETEASRKSHGRTGNGCWTPKYDDYARELISDSSDFAISSTIPAGVEEACPNYAKLTASQRADFWVYLVQALAAVESGFDKYSRFQEATGVYSEGLLQLSYSDRGRAKACTFYQVKNDDGSMGDHADSSIFEAKTNLQCGIGILWWELYADTSTNGGKGLFHTGSYWHPFWKTANRGAVAKCVKEAAGDESKVLGCQGLSFRRILSQFWAGYPEDANVGVNLCGLSNHLEFCGAIQCDQQAQTK